MGAFSIFIIGFIAIIVLIIFYISNAVFVINLDGILSVKCHNKHKKALVICNIGCVVFWLLYIGLQLLHVPVFSKIGFHIFMGIMLPVCIFNTFIFSLMHRKKGEKVKKRNVIFTLIGFLLFVAAGALVVYVPYDIMYGEVLEFKYYHGKKKSLVDYTLDDGTNSKKVCEKLKKRLEKDDSDVNESNAEHEYAIHNACLDKYLNYSPRRYEILKLLIEHGADVNMPDDSGERPLYILCEYEAYTCDDKLDTDNWLKCVKLLLDNGADPTIEDKEVESVCNYVKEKERDYEYASNEFKEKKYEAMHKLKNLLIEYGYEEEFEETEE